MLCKYCNQPTPDGSAFCQMCGKSLIDGADVPAPGEPIPSVRPEGQTVTLPAAEDTASSDADASRLESVLSPAENPLPPDKNKKVRKCRFCGNPVDRETGLCTHCGKAQPENKLPKILHWAATGVLAAAVVGLIIGLFAASSAHRAEVSTLSDEIAQWQAVASQNEERATASESVVSALESRITEKDEVNSQLQDTLSETQEQVDALQGDLDSALEQNQALSGSDAQKKADFLDSYYLSWDSDIMDDVVTCHKFNCKHLPENEALLLIPSYFILVEGYELCPDCCF